MLTLTRSGRTFLRKVAISTLVWFMLWSAVVVVGLWG